MDSDSQQIIQRLRNVLAENQMQFTKNCFDILYSECSTPSRIFEVFRNFVYSILVNPSENDKKSAIIDKIFTSIQNSPYLLDSLLSALYEWNLQPCSSFTVFHKYLNETLTKRDWSRLETPSIVISKDQADPNQPKVINSGIHATDQCIFEIVFSHTPTDVLAKSQFVDI